VTNWLERLTGETQARLLGLLRRSPQTITSLASALGLTDNAVRLHVAAGTGGGARTAANPQQRLEAAAGVFRTLGSDAHVDQTTDGWSVQAHGCPLSAVTAGHPEMCELGKALVEEVVGAPVTECCERGARPRCSFTITTE
jgi:predicted ArsR family transcriptional regulator